MCLSNPGARYVSRGQVHLAGQRAAFSYIAVLGTALIVSTLAMTGLTLVRVKTRTARDTYDALAARQHARSAIEMGRLLIDSNPGWRNSYTNDQVMFQKQLGIGGMEVRLRDPIDGDLANRPHDPVVLTATGWQGQARQTVRVTLQARPTPLPALRYAVHTGGQFRVRSSRTFTADGATISTNGSLRNEGTIVGSVDADSASHVGNITGTLRLGVPAKAFPNPAVPNHYASLGTEVPASSTMQRFVLAPGYNPWGTTNDHGVYVLRPSGNVTIRYARIHGTLVVLLPAGRTLTIENEVLFHPASQDFPVLIVVGDLKLDFQSEGAVLSETTNLTNFNPPGAPYKGKEDLLILDTYPSEIQGLVHVTGKIEWRSSARVRGAVICESTANSGAVDAHDNPEVIYDPNLYSNPPQWYTTAVPMVVQPGTWQQVVESDGGL